MRFATFAIALTMTTIFAAALTAGPARAGNKPGRVRAAFHTAYVPEGFDSNDNVQLVGEGTFRNTCYRPAPPKIHVDQRKMLIKIQPMAYFYDDYCLQVLVDWDQTIDVGILKAGKYKIYGEGELLPLAELNVRVATRSGPDDYLYAPVSQAFARTEAGVTKITVAGDFRNSCLRLVDVIVNVQPKVVTVQPISEWVEERYCAQGIFPFEKTVTPPAMPRGKYLLHVRSLNGKAVNNLFEVQ